MDRRETLDLAIQTVCNDRQDQHGAPEDSFARIAALWTGYWRAMGHDITVTGWDVGNCMSLFKIGRSIGNPMLEDNYIDQVGYGALTCELATQPKVNTTNT